MQKHIILGTSLTLLAALITGCNSNDDDNAALTQVPSTTQVTITPSLGKILNAKVVLKNAKTGVVLGSGITSTKPGADEGTAKFDAIRTTDPVIVEVQGTAGATYFDESTKNSAPFGAGQVIKAVVPTLTSNANIGVSALTDIAYKAALKKAGDNEKSITAAIATASNDAIRTALAPELSSITIAPALVGSADDLTKLTNTPEGKYALRLAALAQLVPNTDTTPALTALQKLAEDFADGTFDGMANGAAIGLYTQANLQNKIQTNLTSIINTANLSGVGFSVNAFTFGFGEIKITIGTTGGTGSNGGIPTGNFNLTIETSVSGLGSLPIPTVTIKNIPKPDTQDVFCNDSSVKGALPSGAITITGCSFSGNTGSISVQLNQGIQLNYTVKYTYTAV